MIINKVLKDPGIIFGLACVLLIAVLGIFAPLLAPQNPNSQILEFRHKPPGFKGEIIRYRLAPELPEISMAFLFAKPAWPLAWVNHTGLLGETALSFSWV